jgi:hypothetical protein
VNNYVEKRPLDSRKARTNAAYNKLPFEQANSRASKIKDLATTQHALVRKLRR